MFETIAGGMMGALGRLDDAMLVIGIFTAVLLGLFAAALALIARGRAANFYRSVPSLLTTIGIVGTFLGISTGLLHFDAGDVEASIPMLLDGLKLAFITSITGIVLAVLLRLVLVLGVEGDHAAHGSAELSDAGALQALVVKQSQVAEAQLIATQRLLDQLGRLDQRLIHTLETHHEQMLGAMTGFASQLSELGSRQLIAALESVIRDFNNSLGEQFGENFRRLDSSVERLVHWQDQYRQHMNELGGQLDCAIQGVEKSESSLQRLTEQARQISTYVEDQQAGMESLRREAIELEALLSSIADLRDKAKAAFPAIDTRLKAMLDSIENAVISALAAQQRIDHAVMDGRSLNDARIELSMGARA